MSSRVDEDGRENFEELVYRLLYTGSAEDEENLRSACAPKIVDPNPTSVDDSMEVIQSGTTIIDNDNDQVTSVTDSQETRRLQICDEDNELAAVFALREECENLIDETAFLETQILNYESEMTGVNNLENVSSSASESSSPENDETGGIEEEELESEDSGSIIPEEIESGSSLVTDLLAELTDLQIRNNKLAKTIEKVKESKLTSLQSFGIEELEEHVMNLFKVLEQKRNNGSDARTSSQQNNVPAHIKFIVKTLSQYEDMKGRYENLKRLNARDNLEYNFNLQIKDTQIRMYQDFVNEILEDLKKFPCNIDECDDEPLTDFEGTIDKAKRMIDNLWILVENNEEASLENDYLHGLLNVKSHEVGLLMRRGTTLEKEAMKFKELIRLMKDRLESLQLQCNNQQDPPEAEDVIIQGYTDALGALDD